MDHYTACLSVPGIVLIAMRENMVILPQNGWAEEWMNEWMNKWMNEKMIEQNDRMKEYKFVKNSVLLFVPIFFFHIAFMGGQ